MKKIFVIIIAFILFVGTGRGLSLQAQNTPDKDFYFGAALEGHPITRERLAYIEKEFGVKPDIVLFFIPWPSDDNIFARDFPRESLDAIWCYGAVPCFTWEPMFYKNYARTPVYYQVILTGVYDAYIRDFARQARLWGKPFIMRFAHEMNLSAHAWGNLKWQYSPESPTIYKKIYRHVFSIFKKERADNVFWAFCPNVDSVPGAANGVCNWNTIKNYYPGDEYVDILGMDGYNWGTTQTKEKNGWDSSWWGFKDIFKNAYSELREINPQKPIIIFETAGAGGDKPAWVKDMFKEARDMGLKGVIWFEAGKENDWRINSSGKIELEALLPKNEKSAQEWIKGLKK